MGKEVEDTDTLFSLPAHLDLFLLIKILPSGKEGHRLNPRGKKKINPIAGQINHCRQGGEVVSYLLDGDNFQANGQLFI